MLVLCDGFKLSLWYVFGVQNIANTLIYVPVFFFIFILENLKSFGRASERASPVYRVTFVTSFSKIKRVKKNLIFFLFL